MPTLIDEIVQDMERWAAEQTRRADEAEREVAEMERRNDAAAREVELLRAALAVPPGEA